MKIELKDRMIVIQETEEHFKLDVEGKEVCISKYNKFDEFGIESDIEIFKGNELLTEEEREEITDFVVNINK